MRWTPYLHCVHRFWNNYPRPRSQKPISSALVLESLEDRAVPAILFSSTGSRTITDTGGPILSRMQVDLIFWGSGWNSGGGPALRTNVQNTVTAILNSTYFDGLFQYRGIGHGSLLRSDTITTTNPPANFTTQPGGDVSTFVANNINNNTLPSPNGQILYLVVPQSGSSPSDCGCDGRHLADYASGNRVFPYGLTTNYTNISLDRLAVIMSHEMAEAATNPEWNITIGGRNQAAFHVPGNVGDEIGDGEPANTYLYRLNGALVQAYLSQNDHSYIVPTGGTNNFLVSSTRVLTLQVSGRDIQINRFNNGVFAELEGSTAQFEPGSIHSIVVNGTITNSIMIERTGADAPVTVNLGNFSESVAAGFHNLDDIQGSITVHGGTGFDVLSVNDDAAPANLTYTVTDSSVTRPGMGGAVITFSGHLDNVYLFGGHGNNVYNVNNTKSGATTIVNTGDGSGEVNVARTTGSLTVNLGRGVDLVTVGGQSRNLDSISGGITVAGGSGGSVLIVDDGGKSFFGINTVVYAVTSSSVQRTGTPAISYSGLATLDIHLGANPVGFLQVAISGTASGTHTTIFAGATAPNLIAAGSSNSSLDSIRGSLAIRGSQGRGELLLADEGTTSAESYTLTSALGSGFFTRSGSAQVTYDNSISAVVLSAARSVNTIEVLATLPGTGTDIDAGSGGDVVNVRSTSSPLIVTLHNSRNIVNVGSTANSLDAIQGTITLNGPGQDSSLNVNDQGTAAVENYTLTANTISRSGVAAITYSNFPIVTLNGGGAGNSYTVTSTSATGVTSLNTGNGVDTVNVQATATPLVVAAGSGGNDIINLGIGGSVQAIRGQIDVFGNSSSASLNIDDSADPGNRTVVLDSLEPILSVGIIDGLAPAEISYGFEDGIGAAIGALTVTGGSGNNTYTVNDLGAPQGTTLNTGSGLDAVHVQGNSWPLTINSAAGSGADLITLGDSANTLLGIFSPVTVQAAATDALVINDQGTSTAQTYTISATAIARSNGPTVNYTGLCSLTLNAGNGGNTFAVQGTATGTTLMLHGSGGANTLQGPDSDTAWQISGTDAGSLSGGVSFTSMQNLTGGAGNNTFAFQDGGSLDGMLTGGGTGTLDYSTGWSSNVLVNLQTGLVSGVGGGVTNIQNVIGASGGGAGFYNILVGNGGNYLQGGDDRRNLLIAGPSASTLVGGNGDDILIGGTTAYDQEADMHSLIAIMNYWAGTTDDYFTRVNNLTTGNGVPLLDPTTVFNNGGGNTLLGNNGGAGEMNLFYGLDPTLETTDYNPGIGEVFINVPPPS